MSDVKTQTYFNRKFFLVFIACFLISAPLFGFFGLSGLFVFGKLWADDLIMSAVVETIQSPGEWWMVVFIVYYSYGLQAATWAIISSIYTYFKGWPSIKIAFVVATGFTIISYYRMPIVIYKLWGMSEVIQGVLQAQLVQIILSVPTAVFTWFVALKIVFGKRAT
jgi:hypothetical protein